MPLYLFSCFFCFCCCFHLVLALKRGSLPPVLYLQLDNCYRDCKNIHILGFCALLVKAGVFKKVVFVFLKLKLGILRFTDPNDSTNSKFRGQTWRKENSF